MNPEGREFEALIFKMLLTSVTNGELGILPENAKLRLRPKYFSLDRNDAIEVDVAIETWLPGDQRPTLLWVWECKCCTRPVTVEEVELFHAKLEQLGLHKTKGSMISTSGFTAAAKNYAERLGIGQRTIPKERALVGPQIPPPKLQDTKLEGSQNFAISGLLLLFAMAAAGYAVPTSAYVGVVLITVGGVLFAVFRRRSS